MNFMKGRTTRRRKMSTATTERRVIIKYRVERKELTVDILKAFLCTRKLYVTNLLM